MRRLRIKTSKPCRSGKWSTKEEGMALELPKYSSVTGEDGKRYKDILVAAW